MKILLDTRVWLWMQVVPEKIANTTRELWQTTPIPAAGTLLSRASRRLARLTTRRPCQT